jgi:hypothetical protein
MLLEGTKDSGAKSEIPIKIILLLKLIKNNWRGIYIYIMVFDAHDNANLASSAKVNMCFYIILMNYIFMKNAIYIYIYICFPTPIMII